MVDLEDQHACLEEARDSMSRLGYVDLVRIHTTEYMGRVQAIVDAPLDMRRKRDALHDARRNLVKELVKIERSFGK